MVREESGEGEPDPQASLVAEAASLICMVTSFNQLHNKAIVEGEESCYCPHAPSEGLHKNPTFSL